MELVFLAVLAIIWIIFAVIQDFKHREIANWLNFSLIIFALAFRGFYSVVSNNANYIIQGLFGLAVFFVLGNFFYYARLFAGGDAKLLIALGAILPFGETFLANLVIFISFIFLLLIVGSVYGLIYSFVVIMQNKKAFIEEFRRQFDKTKKMFNLFNIIAIILLIIIMIINEVYLILFPFLFFIFPWLFIYARAVENACMLKLIPVDNLTIGDWLAKEIKVGRKKIKPSWQGLTEEELRLIQKKYKNKKILVKQGVPFSISFLIAFILLLLFRNSCLIIKELF